MSGPFTNLFWRLKNMHRKLSELHTAVHLLQSFIDVNIASYNSEGGIVAPEKSYLCPGAKLDIGMGRNYNWSRLKSTVHAKDERARMDTAFYSLTSEAWKISFDIHNLKFALDIVVNFPKPTYSQAIANNNVFSILDGEMERVMQVYRYIKADMA